MCHDRHMSKVEVHRMDKHSSNTHHTRGETSQLRVVYNIRFHVFITYFHRIHTAINAKHKLQHCVWKKMPIYLRL